MLFSILFFVCFCVSPFKVVWRFFAGLGTASEDVETMSVGQVGLRDEREHTEKERERHFLSTSWDRRVGWERGGETKEKKESKREMKIKPTIIQNRGENTEEHRGGKKRKRKRKRRIRRCVWSGALVSIHRRIQQKRRQPVKHLYDMCI